MSKLNVGEGFVFPDASEQDKANNFDIYKVLPEEAKDLNDAVYEGLSGNFDSVVLGSELANVPASISGSTTYKMYVIAKSSPDGSTTNELTLDALQPSTETGKWIRQASPTETITSIPWTEITLGKKLGYVLATWGANLQTLGRHPAINSPSNSAQITSLGIMASMPVPAAGTLDTLTYYNNTGDNTTEFQIIKNGVVVYSFTCTGPYGVETGVNVPIGFVGSVPDNIAIRYSAGTAPSEGLYTAYIN